MEQILKKKNDLKKNCVSLNLEKCTMKLSGLSELLQKEALSLGFARMGICNSGLVDNAAAKRFSEWIALGYNAQMEYLSQNIDKRFNPDLLWEHETKSVIVLLLNYYSASNEEILNKAKYKIARYAHGKNYHNVMKKKLKTFCNKFEKITHGHIKAYVDTAPLMEKYWAAKAGLGMQGKNTCLIVPGLGSWFFLAVCITDVKLEPSNVFTSDLCEKCTLCMDACPTGALIAPGKLDAKKCIAYLTIEHKDKFVKNTPHWNDWIWGCDICQEACPHNSNPEETKIEDFNLLPIIRNLMNGHFCSDSFDRDFSGTSLKRGGKEKIPENINRITKNSL